MRLYDFITANVTETIKDNNKINFNYNSEQILCRKNKCNWKLSNY